MSGRQRVVFGGVCTMVFLLVAAIPARAQYNYQFSDDLRVPGDGINLDFWGTWPNGGSITVTTDGTVLSDYNPYLGLLPNWLSGPPPVAKWLLEGDFTISFHYANSANARVLAGIYEVVPAQQHQCGALAGSGFRGLATMGAAGSEPNVNPDPTGVGAEGDVVLQKTGANVSVYWDGSLVTGWPANQYGRYVFYMASGTYYSPVPWIRAADFVIQTENLISCEDVPVPEDWIMGNGDADADGVADDHDQCADTPAGATVDGTGCSLDQLVPCDGNWRNHGQYVSAMVKEGQRFRDEGLIDSSELGSIVAAAAMSSCGQKK